MGKLLELRQQKSDLTDPQFIEWANETLYIPKTYFISYRTIRYQISLISGVGAAKSKTEMIMQMVQATDSLVHQMLLIPGDEKGSGGGVDISLVDSQQMVDAIHAQGVLTLEEAAALKDLGRTATKRYEDWGYTQFGETELSTIQPETDAFNALVGNLPAHFELSRAPDGFDIFDIPSHTHLHYVDLPTSAQVISDLGANNNG